VILHVETGQYSCQLLELLVMQTTQKAQQEQWMDPSKDWGQNEGS